MKRADDMGDVFAKLAVIESKAEVNRAENRVRAEKIHPGFGAFVDELKVAGMFGRITKLESAA
ncbi:MAG: hypothetical protein ACREPX_01660 [Rhodanobacteraceae bacterium]